MKNFTILILKNGTYLQFALVLLVLKFSCTMQKCSQHDGTVAAWCPKPQILKKSFNVQLQNLLSENDVTILHSKNVIDKTDSQGL